MYTLFLDELVFVLLVELLGFAVGNDRTVKLFLHPEVDQKFILDLFQCCFEFRFVLDTLFLGQFHKEHFLDESLFDHILLCRVKLRIVCVRCRCAHERFRILLRDILTVHGRQDIRCYKR